MSTPPLRDTKEAVLELQHLQVEFASRAGPLRALDDVSLVIHAGEMVGVVGESGAGKSLTGAAVIGLIEPPGRIVGGRVVFKGERIDNLPAEALRQLRGRHIGAIFQDPMSSLNPLYSVGHQLIETVQTHLGLNAAQARERAIGLLQQNGIEGAAQRLAQYPHQFSGGMRQRVVIALALAGEPQLLVADEPTTALDVSVQAQILAVLERRCREHGTAVLLITHDMGVVAESCNRVVVMYAGRVVEQGPVRSVIHSPAHPYTVGLMGAIPSLDGTYERLVQIDGSMPRLADMPEGCAFHPRCPRAFERCRVERPPLVAVGDSQAACWLHVDAGSSQA
ncbi:MAG: hypothetical protein RLZZ618_2602 [Pseudomonadota bacterium]|jgi:peptide/nickel transport system ATP-binding protein